MFILMGYLAIAIVLAAVGPDIARNYLAESLFTGTLAFCWWCMPVRRHRPLAIEGTPTAMLRRHIASDMGVPYIAIQFTPRLATRVLQHLSVNATVLVQESWPQSILALQERVETGRVDQAEYDEYIDHLRHLLDSGHLLLPSAVVWITNPSVIAPNARLQAFYTHCRIPIVYVESNSDPAGGRAAAAAVASTTSPHPHQPIVISAFNTLALCAESQSSSR
jgi:hypothetical protein